MHVAPIPQYELAFAVHSGHSLRNAKRVSLEDLVDEPLILPPHSSLSWILDRAFAVRGLKHHVRFHISDQHTLMELAAEGFGIGVTTRFAIALYSELSLHTIEVAGADLKVAGVAMWTERGVRNRTVQALVRMCRRGPGRSVARPSRQLTADR